MNDQTSWPSKNYAWFFTTLLLITYTVSFIDRAMINLLIDPIRSDLGLSDIQMGQILGPGFMISYILFSLPVGRMVDKFNSCLLYTSPSPRDRQKSRMPSSA